MPSDIGVRFARPARIAGFAFVAAIMSACFGGDPGPEPMGGCPEGKACSPTPVMVSGGNTFVKLAAGRFHTCGLLANGEAWCWGLNTAGQLGATTTPGELGSGTPLKVGGTMTFTDITAGDFHTCAIGTDDGLWCWGSNETLVLGVSNVSEDCNGGVCSRTPVRGAGTETFSALDAGSSHNCGVNLGGTARCWGVNAAGELGSADYLQARSDPVTVSGDNTFFSISAGIRFSCGLDGVGVLLCWGLANEGQLASTQFQTCTSGINNFPCSPTPLAANTPIRFSEISIGGAFGCGRTTANAILCWGANGSGQLGSGSFVGSVAPVEVSGGGSWQAVTAGVEHACGLKSGEAFCWGVNNWAQLGDGTAAFAHNAPQPVSTTRTFTQIVAGAQHTCALASDGSVWCWGSDDAKQLGQG